MDINCLKIQGGARYDKGTNGGAEVAARRPPTSYRADAAQIAKTIFRQRQKHLRVRKLLVDRAGGGDNDGMLFEHVCCLKFICGWSFVSRSVTAILCVLLLCMIHPTPSGHPLLGCPPLCTSSVHDSPSPIRASTFGMPPW